MCRLVPLWVEVAGALGAEPVFVHVLRHPQEVAESLARREGMPPRVAWLSWLRHALEAERATRGRPRVFVGYDELLADWKAVAQRVGGTLGITWPEPVASASPRLPASLRHHRHEDEGSALEALPRWVRVAHGALLALHDGPNAAATRRLDETRRQLEAADELAVEAAPAPYAAADATGYLAHLRWDHGQLDARSTIGEIVGGDPVGFDVEPENAGFCAFELLFGTYARTNTSTLVVRLSESQPEGSAIEVERWELPAVEIENDRWRAFRFAPRMESRGRRYRVELSSPDARPGDAVTIYAAADGAAAYRAYFARLEPAPAREPEAAAGPETAELAERIALLEVEARERQSLLEATVSRLERLSEATVPQLVEWAGRVPGMEERIGALELEGVRRPELEQRLQVEAEARRAEVARAREELASLGERLDGLRAEVDAARAQRSRTESAVEREAARVDEQRGQLERLGEQLEVLQELHRATREAGETGRREQELQLTRAQAAVDDRLAALREEERELREALERTLDARVSGVEQRVQDGASDRRRAEDELAVRLGGLEARLLEAADRVEGLQRQTDRDLGAIGDALEEVWG